MLAYDVFDILCTYWKCQLRTPDALYKRLLELPPNRDTFKRVKERLKRHWTGVERMHYQDVAAHYYFNSNTSYGPHFLGWPSDVYLSDARYSGMIEKARAFSAPSLRVECGRFENTMPSSLLKKSI